MCIAILQCTFSILVIYWFFHQKVKYFEHNPQELSFSNCLDYFLHFSNVLYQLCLTFIKWRSYIIKQFHMHLIIIIHINIWICIFLYLTCLNLSKGILGECIFNSEIDIILDTWHLLGTSIVNECFKIFSQISFESTLKILLFSSLFFSTCNNVDYKTTMFFLRDSSSTWLLTLFVQFSCVVWAIDSWLKGGKGWSISVMFGVFPLW